MEKETKQMIVIYVGLAGVFVGLIGGVWAYVNHTEFIVESYYESEDLFDYKNVPDLPELGLSHKRLIELFVDDSTGINNKESSLYKTIENYGTEFDSFSGSPKINGEDIKHIFNNNSGWENVGFTMALRNETLYDLYTYNIDDVTETNKTITTYWIQMKYEFESWVLYAGHEGTAVTTSLKYNDELKHLNIIDVNTYKKKY